MSVSAHDTPGKRSNTHALGWALSLLVVPVMYVLTLPVLTHCLQFSAGYTDYDALPKAWQVYYIPGQWLYGRSPAKEVLGEYARWWGKVLRG
jgi:hypothetical protein